VTVSRKPYTENEYVKTGTCNFEIVNTVHILLEF